MCFGSMTTQPIRYSESKLPTRFGEFAIVTYRQQPSHPVGDADDKPYPQEHCALILGGNLSEPVLARVHSECLTGEAFHSLRCDCRHQLDLALERISENDSGVLVYLRQEGRGIGLGNKVKAYALQDEGADTVDANTRLGLPADARDYKVAASILGDLGVRSVRLMTNNPNKVEALEAHGIVVTQRVGHEAAPNAHNSGYLRTKQQRMGHQLTLPKSDK